MKKIKVGFDFDKVFVDYPPFVPSLIINYLYKKKNHELSYRIPGRLEQKIRLLSHAHFLRKPINKNISALAEVFERKQFLIYLISSRFSFLRKRTNDWNKRHEISRYFEKMFFNFNDEQPHIFKARIIKKEKIEKYIDDDLDLLLFLSRKNPNVEFYWLGKGNKDLPRNIKRIKDVQEFLDKYV